MRAAALFSNDDRSVIHVQRPVLLRGIEEFVRRGDLSDRSVYLNLPPIDDDNRRREDEFWPAFRQDQPKIFGGLLDAIAGGLANCRQSISRRCRAWLTSPPSVRLSASHLGWPAGTLLADYNANRREASATQLEDSLVANLLLKNSDRLGGWNGTASELLSLLSRAVGGRSAASSSLAEITRQAHQRTAPHCSPSFACTAYPLISREAARAVSSRSQLEIVYTNDATRNPSDPDAGRDLHSLKTKTLHVSMAHAVRGFSLLVSFALDGCAKRRSSRRRRGPAPAAIVVAPEVFPNRSRHTPWPRAHRGTCGSPGECYWTASCSNSPNFDA